MFLLGCAAFVHEVFIGQIERPFLIAAACALMGLPFVLRGAEIHRNNRNNKGG